MTCQPLYKVDMSATLQGWHGVDMSATLQTICQPLDNDNVSAALQRRYGVVKRLTWCRARRRSGSTTGWRGRATGPSPATASGPRPHHSEVGMLIFD